MPGGAKLTPVLSLSSGKCFFSQEVNTPGEMGLMQAVVATAVLLTRLSQIVNAFFHAL
jgi:hypothetical protein